jgi:hypothetical protein
MTVLHQLILLSSLSEMDGHTAGGLELWAINFDKTS